MTTQCGVAMAGVTDTSGAAPSVPQEQASYTAQAFDTTRSVRGDVHTLTLSGELDLAARPRFELDMFQLFSDGPARVILDLSGLTFIDSTGVSLVLLARDEAQKHGCGLEIIRGHANVHRIFELTG